MEKKSTVTEKSRALEELHDKLKNRGQAAGKEELEQALWKVLLSCQECLFYTASGLPFSYIVKRRKDGAYSGELIISRKEGSKTLTRSSVMLAFHRVLDEGWKAAAAVCSEEKEPVWIPAEFKGPKAIGQVFGISYIYSMFWKWGLIRVPEKKKDGLMGN